MSPVQKFDMSVGPIAISPNGDRVLLESGGGFAETPSTGGLGNSYGSTRTSSGWATRPLNLPATDFSFIGVRRDNLSDLSQTLVNSPTPAQREQGQTAFYFRGIDGSLSPASPVIQNGVTTRPDGVSGDFVQYGGAARDLSSFVFTTRQVNALPAPDPAGRSAKVNIYEVVGARTPSPTVRRVDVDDSGAVASLACGSEIGGEGRRFNAVAADGSVIFFTGVPSEPPTSSCPTATRGRLRVLARIGGARTVEVSASTCDRVADPAAVPPVTACGPPQDVRFEGASADGQRVYLTTKQQLTDDDTNAATDLYEYRFGPGHDAATATLTRVSAADASVATPTSGGDVAGVVRIADDGRRAYFVAGSVLTTHPNGRGQSAAAGASNLYLFERTPTHPSGRLRFVASLDPFDAASLWAPWEMFGLDNRPAQLAGPSSKYLVFSSYARLVAGDTDGTIDIYRYDAETGDMVLVSGGSGAESATIMPMAYGVASLVNPGLRQVSGDGEQIVFRTKAALVSEDVNGKDDIYLWRNGDIGLITDGRGPEAGQFEQANFYGISEDGNSVVFATAQRLVDADVDSAVDVYVARVGGGFPSTTPLPTEPCVGQACQGDSPPLAPLAGPPLTAGFAGPGDLVPAPVSPPAMHTVTKVKTARGVSVTLRVKVPQAGTIKASGAALVPISRSVKKAGTYRIKVKLTKRAQRTLRRKHRLKVRVRTRFTLADGAISTATTSVTFRPKAKSARAESSRAITDTTLSSGARKGR